MDERSEEELRQLYPVAEILRPLDGYDVERTKRRITAFVVIQETDGGRSLRFYSWQNRKSGWKTDLARLRTERWDFTEIAYRAQQLRERYIGRR